MDIITLGSGERLIECSSVLSQYTDGDTDRVVVLPVPTTRDGNLIVGTDMPLEEIYRHVKPDTLVAGYGIPDRICKEIHTRGGVIYDIMLDEGFLDANARLTAEGVLGRMMCLGETSIGDMKIGIVGYGRIGRHLTRLLLFFGAGVRVFTGKDEVILTLGEISVDARSYNDMDLSGIDILINTAPSDIVAKQAAPCPEIIDLASGNYLEGMERVTKMPSVPEKMYPRSAGRLYAEFIKLHL